MRLVSSLLVSSAASGSAHLYSKGHSQRVGQGVGFHVPERASRAGACRGCLRGHRGRLERPRGRQRAGTRPRRGRGRARAAHWPPWRRQPELWPAPRGVTPPVAKRCAAEVPPEGAEQELALGPAQRPRHAPAGGGQAPSTSGLAAAVAPVAQTASGSGGGGGGKRKAAAAGRAVDATAKSAAAKAAAKAAAEEERVKREVKEAMARSPSRWRGWPSGRRRRRSGGGRRRSRWRSGGERGRQTCRWSLPQAAVERAVGIIWWRELRESPCARQAVGPTHGPTLRCVCGQEGRQKSLW